MIYKACEDLSRMDRALSRFILLTYLEDVRDGNRMYGYGFDAVLIESKINTIKLIVDRQWAQRAPQSEGRRRRTAN